ncbi:uncharacterized protein LOC128988655 isoform X4 [Macrosteles quadrilineatus]|uniref:uncharacterized protein LOC128988655 isoform X4 n=1 Tax=Macrosteles quadrilineatus TaxID=74068 RepID=UPI0023E2DA2F|nr:uncharacterized protein LOC128988655 isoform X4 [Macrosteles quadrilineatus]
MNVIMNYSKQVLMKTFSFSKINILIFSRATVKLYCEHSKPLNSSRPRYSFSAERFVTTCVDCRSPLKSCTSYSSIYNISSYQSPLLRVHLNHQSPREFQRRFKSKKESKGPEYDSDSDGEDNDEGESRATKPIFIKTQSMRVDGLVKKVLGIARKDRKPFLLSPCFRLVSHVGSVSLVESLQYNNIQINHNVILMEGTLRAAHVLKKQSRGSVL